MKLAVLASILVVAMFANVNADYDYYYDDDYYYDSDWTAGYDEVWAANFAKAKVGTACVEDTECEEGMEHDDGTIFNGYCFGGACNWKQEAKATCLKDTWCVSGKCAP